MESKSIMSFKLIATGLQVLKGVFKLQEEMIYADLNYEKPNKSSHFAGVLEIMHPLLGGATNITGTLSLRTVWLQQRKKK